MKYKLITILLLAASLSANAQLSGNGYYRLQNATTTRYVRIIDNRGSIDVASTDVDLGALQTVLNFQNVDYDPATVMYISKLNSTDYNIATQGISLYSMMGFGIKFRATNKGTYGAYQEKAGMAKYLNDTPVASANDIYGYVLSNSSQNREWNIIPVSAESDNYLGVKPQVCIDGKYYCAYYSGFPFIFASDGMKAFYVTHVDTQYGICVTEELSGTIPASTPVIIECQSEYAKDNRLELLAPGTAVPPVSGNLLAGAYFQNNSNKHRNRVDYDSKTMRVLGQTDNGVLGFVKDSKLTAIAANTCYLKADNVPAQLVFMNQDEYDEFLIEAGVRTAAEKQVVPVYSITGKALDIMSDELDRLPQGIYIVNGKKYIVR